MPVATHAARYYVLGVELPGCEPCAAGVLLEDPSTDRLWIRVRRDLAGLAGDDAEVLSELESDLASKAAEMGASRLTESLCDTLSNTIRITDRRETMVADFERGLASLYRQHVHTPVQPFVTHLPRFSLAVAAGPFLENREPVAEGWEEAPPGMRLSREMFVAKIAGRSMEPEIPDASLCVFRRGVVGSREGRLVLVEDSGAGPDDRYTVKRYRSSKSRRTDDTWSHDRITLESLNPDFPAFDLSPEEDRFHVLAEFVAVLD